MSDVVRIRVGRHSSTSESYRNSSFPNPNAFGNRYLFQQELVTWLLYDGLDEGLLW